MTPLPDAQVAALVDHPEVEADNRDFDVSFWLHPSWPVADTIKALALEVQQSRQRRCGNCAHLLKRETYNMHLHWCRTLRQDVGLDWFCADFHPKP